MKILQKRMRQFMSLLLSFLVVGIQFIPPFVPTAWAIDNNTYGIVYFRTKGCSQNTNFTDTNGVAGYTNGCYGADAAFLGYNADKTSVKFKLAGVTGWVNASDVKVFDYVGDQINWKKLYTSNYYVENNVLIHNVMNDIYSYNAGAAITLGPKPSFLTNGSHYWSYDGHYFYNADADGFKKMITDYRNGNYNNAINKGNPYYNYYQYVTHRTISNYTPADIANYMKSLGITSKMSQYPAGSGQSLLYGEQTSFIQYQNEFGANAGLVFGLANNESARGTSQIAYYNKNLFGHAAYDSSPGASASAYLSVAQSIYAHDRFYVSEGYLDPCDSRAYAGAYSESTCHKGRYAGGHVGDKASGMNVHYASDPYWGDKAAQYYYLLDHSLGMQDYNKYTIAVKEGSESLSIRKEATNTSTELYKTGKNTSYPVIVLAKVTGQSINGNNVWYKIQTDPVLNSGRTSIVQDSGYYNYNNNYAYVHSSGFKIVNTGKTLKNRYDITFDANGGMYSDGTTGTKTITVEQNVVPEINAPTKSGDTFMGWSPTVMGATSNTTYRALWKNTKYNITFNAGSGKFADGKNTKTLTLSAGEKPNVENPTRDGYKFTGWDKTVSTVTGDATYHALWEKVTVYYDITFDAKEGKFSDNVTSKIVKVEEGKMPTVEEPTRSGYVFTGWSPAIKSASASTTYTATWEKEVYYDITFDAGEGKFADGSKTKVVSTLKGKLPSVETPTRLDYVFTGWSPALEKASASKTYTATWRKGSVEDYLGKKDGEFYLDYLKEENGKLKIKGYHVIKGINNNIDTPITYEFILKNQTTGEEYTQVVDRMLDEKKMTMPILNSGGYNYKYAWFEDTLDFDNIENGDYTAYFRVRTDKYYTKSYVQNMLLNNQVTEYQTNAKHITIVNDYMTKDIPMQFIVRKQQIGKKETAFDVNQYTIFNKLNFENNKLHIVAASYSVGMDMRASNVSMTREIIFENTETFEQKRFNVGSLTKPVYPISLVKADKFGQQKDRAWFDKVIDISDLKPGTYAIYLSTKSNISDYGEFNDLMFSDLSKSRATINQKKFTFKVNEDKRNRIELVVE